MNFKYLFVLSLTIAFSSAVLSQDFNDSTDSSDDFGNSVYNKFAYKNELSTDPNDYDVNVNFGEETNLRKIFSDKFRYQWYVQLGGGLQTIWGANDSKETFAKRLTVSPILSAGYRFNNKFGLRLTVSGGTVHGFNDGRSGRYRYWKKKGEGVREDFLNQIKADAYGGELPEKLNQSHISQIDPLWIDKGYTYGGDNKTKFDDNVFYSTGASDENLLGFIWGGNAGQSYDNLYMRSTRYIAADLSGTINLTNVFRDGDDSNFFEATLLAGPTLFHTFSNQGNLAWTGFAFHTGLEAQFNVSETVGIFTNVGIQWMPDGFNGQYGGNVFQPITKWNAGLVYKIPTTAYAYIDPPKLDAKDPYLEALRLRLMDEINNVKDYQSEIDLIRKKLAELAMMDSNTPESFLLPDVVEFVIGKSNIRPQEDNVIANVAAYLKENKDASVIVTGFADRGTGNAAINLKLSAERSNAVANALERYGIENDRIAIDWRGDTLQPFAQNDKNRAVLFYIDYSN